MITRPVWFVMGFTSSGFSMLDSGENLLAMVYAIKDADVKRPVCCLCIDWPVKKIKYVLKVWFLKRGFPEKKAKTWAMEAANTLTDIIEEVGSLREQL